MLFRQAEGQSVPDNIVFWNPFIPGALPYSALGRINIPFRFKVCLPRDRWKSSLSSRTRICTRQGEAGTKSVMSAQKGGYPPVWRRSSYPLTYTTAFDLLRRNEEDSVCEYFVLILPPGSSGFSHTTGIRWASAVCSSLCDDMICSLQTVYRGTRVSWGRAFRRLGAANRCAYHTYVEKLGGISVKVSSKFYVIII